MTRGSDASVLSLEIRPGGRESVLELLLPLDAFAKNENVAALSQIRTVNSFVPDVIRRSVAWLLAALVLALVVLTVCPAAHEWLHGDADQADHSCAITLFAQGVTTAMATLAVAPVIWLLLLVAVVRRSVFIQEPEFVHLPGRAPPTA